MKTIDWNAALDAVNSDQDLLLEVIEILQQEIPDLHQQLRRGVADNDETLLRQSAHKLKGSVRFLGPTDVHDIAEQIELTEHSDPRKVADAFAELTIAIDSLSRELSDYVTQSNRQP